MLHGAKTKIKNGNSHAKNVFNIVTVYVLSIFSISKNYSIKYVDKFCV